MLKTSKMVFWIATGVILLTLVVGRKWFMAQAGASEYCKEAELTGQFHNGGAVVVMATICQRGGKWYLRH